MKPACLVVALTIGVAPSTALAEMRPALGSSCASFLSHADIGQALAELAQGSPAIAHAFTAGASVEGRELWALRVSANVREASPEPEIRIIGAIHGDECMSARMVVEVAHWLVEGYGEDALLTQLVDRAQLLLIPLVNPDGYSAQRSRRANAHGVDLNRNLGFAWVDGGPAPFSEPETQALRAVSQESHFVLGLSYHTEATYVNGPWNYTPHHPLGAPLVDTMGHAYAGSSGYDVVFGWDWFGIYGDINDWSLGAQGTLDWTIELRSDTDMEWDVHEAGLRALLPYVFRGISGMVRDAETGEPLWARIDVSPGLPPLWTDGAVGDFHRIALPGTYDLTATAPGYLPATARSIVVTDEEPAYLELDLARAHPHDAWTAFAVTEMTLPREVSGVLRFVPYENRTLAWDGLGAPDGVFYSMSPGGTVTFDMGRLFADSPGVDLEVVSGTSSDDPVGVSLSETQEGPYVMVASGQGDVSVDLRAGGLAQARFVRLLDQGDGPFNDDVAGYDVDAVVVYPPESDRGADPLARDSAPPLDGVATDGTATDGAQGRACGCRAAGRWDDAGGQLQQIIWWPE